MGRPSGYVHSEVFARLKNIREEVKTTFTSFQWLEVLDHFIESAIDPIVTAYPALTDTYFATVVAWQTHRPSIKFSRNDKHSLPVALFNSLTTQDQKKREHQKSMLLNRGLLFGLISLFDKTVNNYLKLHDPLLRMRKVDRKLLMTIAENRCGSPYLYSAARQSRYYATKAYWFKELIVQKYTRLALMNAKNVYQDIEHRIPLNDVIQIYMIYLSKAVDRCDSRQGVLTTFIQTWFYSAKADVMKTALAESKNSSYDDLLTSGTVLNSVAPNTDYEAMQSLCYEAKKLDPQGCMRFVAGIPEHWTMKDQQTLMLFVAR